MKLDVSRLAGFAVSRRGAVSQLEPSSQSSGKAKARVGCSVVAPMQPAELESRPVSSSAVNANVTSFFVLTFAITWLSQGPAVLSQRGLIPVPVEATMPWVGLGLFGPILAAMLLSWFEARGAGLRALFRQLGSWRAKMHWYVVALLLPGAILALGMALHNLLTSGEHLPVLYAPREAPRLVALVLIPFTEEIGWRGFVFPKLQQRFGPLWASLLFGVLWALWHVPMFLLAELDWSAFLWSVSLLVAGSVVFTWLFNRPGGGLPLVILAHMGAHLNNSHLALPGDLTPTIVHALGYCVVAVALVLSNPGAWRRSVAASTQ